MKGFIQAKGAGRVAVRRGVQQLFTDELALWRLVLLRWMRTRA
jgi:hypothetical protein